MYRSYIAHRYACQPTNMRASSLLLVLLPIAASACTMAKVTRNGYTLVGNNEDAFSINACLKFVRGGPGEFGAVYLCHYNGSPLRQMAYQGGMNEAGLMFDGLTVEVKGARPMAGKRSAEGIDLMPLVMRTCADVDAAAAVIGAYNMGWMAGSMIVLVDRSGRYLVVQNDTMFTGNDATYAVGNFRPAACSNFDAVPIPRYQKGRALLAHQADTSLAFCTALMDSMCARRAKLGNGTLYTDILDPQRGLVHLFFYHDLSEMRTFDLKEELAKGDHTIAMALLFGPRPDYGRLLAYVTPFHQRWLWWTLLCVGAFALLSGMWALGMLVAWVFASIRQRRWVVRYPWFTLGVASACTAFLCGTLVMVEGVYYFGLGDATDRIHPLLKYQPLVLCVLAIPLLVWTRAYWRAGGRSRIARAWLAAFTALECALVCLLFYWGMVAT